MAKTNEWELVFDEQSAIHSLNKFVGILKRQKPDTEIGKMINKQHIAVMKVAIRACEARIAQKEASKQGAIDVLTELYSQVERFPFYSGGLLYYIERDRVLYMIQEKINTLRGETENAQDDNKQ